MHTSRANKAYLHSDFYYYITDYTRLFSCSKTFLENLLEWFSTFS